MSGVICHNCGHVWEEDNGTATPLVAYECSKCIAPPLTQKPDDATTLLDEISRLKSELAGRNEVFRRVEKDMVDALHRGDEARAELNEARNNVERFRSSVYALENRVTELKTELAATEKDRDAWRSQCEEAMNLVDSSSADNVRKLKSELAAANAGLALATKLHDIVVQDMAHAMRDAHVLKIENHRLKLEVEGSRIEIGRWEALDEGIHFHHERERDALRAKLDSAESSASDDKVKP